MKREGHPKMGFVWVLQDVMATCGMVHKKAGPLQGSEHSSGGESRQTRAHIASSTTVTFSSPALLEWVCQPG
jgi:hypothetical protein